MGFANHAAVDAHDRIYLLHWASFDPRSIPYSAFIRPLFLIPELFIILRGALK